MKDGDLALLCSDGVSNVLDETVLAEKLCRRSAAQPIVCSARENATAETMDNMSAIVLDIENAGRFRIEKELPLEVPGRLQKGEVVDGFTLVRPFQNGDRVWLATREGQRFVLKFPPVEAGQSEELANLFVKEVWHAVRLQGRGFFPRAFVPERATKRFYAMEFIEAPSLKALLRSRRLAVDEAIALGKFLLAAAQYLLGFDLVHGDLKPENILVVSGYETAQFKLIDFGSVTEVFSITSRAGTASYLAPERFQGAPISERTEIFSLGATLFEGVTRAFAFGEIERFQTPHFHLAKRRGQLNPNLPSWPRGRNAARAVRRAGAALPELLGNALRARAPRSGWFRSMRRVRRCLSATRSAFTRPAFTCCSGSFSFCCSCCCTAEAMPNVPTIPGNAPFSASQRLWLNGFLAGLFAADLPDAATLPAEPASAASTPLLILYGSQTGTAEALARQLAARAKGRGFSARVLEAAAGPNVEWKNEGRLLLVTSTYGDGEPPDNARGLWDWLQTDAARSLAHLKYSVLALGDTRYEHFCAAGKRMDARLEELGAKRVHPLAECDINYEAPARAWMEGVLGVLDAAGPKKEEAKRNPRLESALVEPGLPAGYSRANPFPARLLANRRLTGEGSGKEVRHFELLPRRFRLGL